MNRNAFFIENQGKRQVKKKSAETGRKKKRAPAATRPAKKNVMEDEGRFTFYFSKFISIRIFSHNKKIGI